MTGDGDKSAHVDGDAYAADSSRRRGNARHPIGFAKRSAHNERKKREQGMTVVRLSKAVTCGALRA